MIAPIQRVSLNGWDPGALGYELSRVQRRPARADESASVVATWYLRDPKPAILEEVSRRLGAIVPAPVLLEVWPEGTVTTGRIELVSISSVLVERTARPQLGVLTLQLRPIFEREGRGTA